VQHLRLKMRVRMRAPLETAIFVVAFAFAAPSAFAEPAKPAARDVAAVQSCLGSQRGKESRGERCIGVLADPCLKRPTTRSTADQNACTDREHAVWDGMLNDIFRRLRDKLDDEQKDKLRDMQRAWIESRDKTCAFYYDFYQGTMASPMNAYCNVRETARRAVFLKFFLDEAEGR
jgi:uncharacterized protein YecT (DUF1311 family)